MGDFELILSDNGSREESRALYEDAARCDKRIRYVRHDSNMGAVHNFDFVVKQARADIFAWVADDDLRNDTFLAKGVAALSAHPELVAVQYESALIDGDGRRTGSAQINATAAMKKSPVGRLQALRAQQYNFVIYGLHRTSVLRDLDMTTASVFWDTLQSLDIYLHGPVATIDGDLFSYRLDAHKEDDVYRAHQHMGITARPLGRHKYSDAAFLCVARALASKATLSPSQRAACALDLLAWMFMRGWFTQDQFLQTIPRLRDSWERRQITQTLLLGAKCVSLSPTYPMRRALARFHARNHA